MLDTTACIDFLRGLIDLKEIIDNLDDYLAITTISIYEVNIGLELTKLKISINRYNELSKKWYEFLNSIQIFSLGIKEAEKSAQIYSKLNSKGIKIDDNDILISGIMLSNNIFKILTNNVEHFNKIDGIQVIKY